jgi:hypothetical protein
VGGFSLAVELRTEYLIVDSGHVGSMTLLTENKADYLIMIAALRKVTRHMNETCLMNVSFGRNISGY